MEVDVAIIPSACICFIAAKKVVFVLAQYVTWTSVCNSTGR